MSRSSCQRCGWELVELARFCSSCGAELPLLSDDSKDLAGNDASLSTGERRIITVLVADLEEIQGHLAGRDPEEVAQLLTQVLDAMTAPIKNLGGIPDRSTGDHLTARFGIPISHEDDTERAVRAAWEMLDVSSRLPVNLSLGGQFLPKIGIHTGLAISENFRVIPSRGYVLTGYAEPQANRLAELARPGDILVSAEVANAVRTSFEFVQIENSRTDGPYRVAGPRRGPRTFAGPLIGRHGERLRLHGALLGASHGRPQLITILGEPGIGKTRLSRYGIGAWKTQVHGQVLWAQATPLQQGPLAMLSSLLCNWLGAGDAGIRALESRVATAKVPDQGPSLLLMAPLLVGHSGGAKRGNAPDAQLPKRESTERDSYNPNSLDPETRQALQFQATNDLLVEAATECPILLIFEDIQWVDEPSLRWLMRFIAGIAGREDLPIAILCEARPEAESSIASLGDGLDLTRMYLGALSEVDSARMVGALLGDAQVTGRQGAISELARRLVQKAEGNPFFLEEMVLALETRGVIVPCSKGMELRKDASGEIPDTLMTLVASRLDDLPLRAKRLAQVAAVIGRRFDARLLAELAGPRECEEGLEVLVAAKMVVPDGSSAWHSFAQQIVWEVSYNSLLIRSRKDLHRRVAEALTDHHSGADSGGGDTIASLVAHHWSQAGEADRAALAFESAGLAALAAHSNGDARKYFLSALDWQARTEGNATMRRELLLQLSRVETELGAYDTALALLNDRLKLGPPDAPTCLGKGDVLARKGNFTAALEAYQEAVTRSQDAGGRAWAAAKMASILMRTGSLQKAVDLAIGAKARLEDEGRFSDAAFVHSVLGMCYDRMGDWDSAVMEHQQALVLREKTRDPAGIARSLNNLGIVFVSIGRWSEAFRHYTRALALFRRLGDRGYLGMSLNNLGYLLLAQGDPQLAERHFMEALRLARQIGDTVSIVTALGNLGEVHLVKGAPATALGFLDQCLALAGQITHREYDHEVHLARAKALQALGEGTAALKELEIARHHVRAAGNQAFEGVIDRVLAEQLLEAGNAPEALHLARRAESLLRPTAFKLETGRALVLLGRLLGPGDGDSPLQEGILIFTHLGARSDLELAVGLRREEVSPL